jgi:CHAT domain/Tetratricopeptide repeat
VPRKRIDAENFEPDNGRVAGEARVAGPVQRPADELLLLAVSRPHEALAQARAILAENPSLTDASVAHQAVGIVLREFGDVDSGVAELRLALRLARRTGSAERAADVLATLGVALVYAGQTTDGLAAFDRALQRATGVLTGRVLHRRGIVFWTLGRHLAALDDFRRAIAILRRAGDRTWTARALSARGLVYTAIGSPWRADADFVAAERLFAQTNQELAAVHNVLNRGLGAYYLGDIPLALAYLDEAESRYRPMNVPTPGLSITRCEVLLAAGLAADALAEADAAVREIERIRGRNTKRAELLLMAANCAVAAAQPEQALDWATVAYRLFRSQQSTWWQAHAAGVVIEAKHAAGPISAALFREADQAAGRLDAAGSSAAGQAHLLAGRVAQALGRRADADRHYAAAASSRHRGLPLSRLSGWLGAALQAQAAGQPRRMFTACRRGLEVLDEHRFTLGASELRAQATAHGSELALLAQRQAADSRRPRQLLAWSERWRATSLAVPSVRPQANAELNAGLTALRALNSRLEELRSQGTLNVARHREQLRLEREQLRLEGIVRARSLQARGAHASPAAINVTELLEQLSATRLLELVDVDGVLHVLICGAGRVRHFIAGRVEDVRQPAAFARFALRRIARARAADDVASALAILASAGPQLQDALLGPADQHLGSGPVVIVPPGKLQAIPWALLPALHDRVVTIAPSARAWLRTKAAAPPRRRHVVVARGPGLPTAEAEVTQVARLYDDVTILADGAATTGNLLRTLDGAWLAHIAAHGRFRADSPMFSSLRMHDGPLTVYDFEQLHLAPYRLVLPSCESGVLAPAGADELLGLAASLLPLGTAAILAAVVPVNDQAVLPVMADVHRCLRAGETIAQALRNARLSCGSDPIQQATATSLLALGAA